MSNQGAPGSVNWPAFGRAALALTVGLVCGFLIISRTLAASDRTGVSRERYAIVLSNLYAEGEDIEVVSDYLAPLGTGDPATYLLRTADRFSHSADRSTQRTGEDVKRLGEALRQGVPNEDKVTSAPPPATPTRSRAPATATITQSTQATPTVTPAMAVIKSPQGDGVRLRSEASTNAPALALLATGTKVEILNIVDGQAVTGDEKRWYKVRTDRFTGFVYFSFVSPAD